MLMHILSALLQLVAGVFLGMVGVVLWGDYKRWHRLRYPNSNQFLPGWLMFMTYLFALAVIRFAPHGL